MLLLFTDNVKRLVMYRLFSGTIEAISYAVISPEKKRLKF